MSIERYISQREYVRLTFYAGRTWAVSAIQFLLRAFPIVRREFRTSCKASRKAAKKVKNFYFGRAGKSRNERPNRTRGQCQCCVPAIGRWRFASSAGLPRE